MLEPFRRSFLSTAEFTRRAYAAVEALSPETIRSRPQNGPKELIEEVLPLSALLKHLEIPSRPVRCKYEKDSAPYDATLRFGGYEVKHGFIPRQLFVEVTTAVPPTAHLRRELLNRDGFAYAGPGIVLKGSKGKGDRKLSSRAVAVDGGANLTEAIELTVKRIRAKSSKTYPQPCLLLVNLEPERPLRVTEWSEYVAGVAPAVDRRNFPYAYVADWDQGIVLPLGGV